MTDQSSGGNPLSSKKALVVDDEPFAGQAVGQVLQNVGIGQVAIVESATSAMELLANDATEVDVIICDIMMPEMDGYEFVRRLRYGSVPRFKDIPILMLTAHDTEKNVQSARIHRIDGFIVKPPNLVALTAHLHRIFGLVEE